MSRPLIFLGNLALLVLLVIGLPAAARMRLGDVQISLISTNQKLILAGLVLAVCLNLAGAFFLAKRPQKILCRLWLVVFGGLLMAFFAHTRGWLEFAWLTQALQWLQNHL